MLSAVEVSPCDVLSSVEVWNHFFYTAYNVHNLLIAIYTATVDSPRIKAVLFSGKACCYSVYFGQAVKFWLYIKTQKQSFLVNLKYYYRRK
ncbi:hypothetical protein DDV96_07250 [Marixanthomonas spongiae]|uniref:Uncharacterized protein n=1 Tax=Marixanthomonas spongiae TaxID=2174845 RepID=A0A2U0I268_9FLAO|nr:hypothetical protein DDV96_07250 [Marixanthomonas spongiae]